MVVGLITYDFCYYWHHRLGHESAIFGRRTSSITRARISISRRHCVDQQRALLGWLFYLPMAVIGIRRRSSPRRRLDRPALHYWIHTEHVGRLGWLDRILATPSNHRVHHAINDRTSTELRGILIIWDRLFGSFEPETERCVYGTRAPLDSWDPILANVEIYVDLARKSGRAPRCATESGSGSAPGWRPAALIRRSGQPRDSRSVTCGPTTRRRIRACAHSPSSSSCWRSGDCAASLVLRIDSRCG